MPKRRLDIARKRCSACRREKSLDQFWVCRGNADGFQYACKTCIRKKTSRYRAAHAEETRAYNLKWNREHPKSLSAAARRYRKRHRLRLNEKKRAANAIAPEKERARQAVKRAIKEGRMTRWRYCEMCEAHGTLHAHHSDYSKPLAVIWLCPKCHRAAHA